MTEPFDPHVIIRELAAVQQECICRYVFDRNEGRSATIRRKPREGCLLCNGAGRIVPFASLRVKCLRCEGTGMSLDKRHPEYCGSCTAEYQAKGRGWVPEPDVEKACWRVFKLLPGNMLSDTQLRLTPVANSWEEVVLRAAEAWLKDAQHGTIEERP